MTWSFRNDERLSTNLPKSFPGKNLEVIHGDILQYDFGKINGSYVVAGNIPYYITSPIIEKVLRLSNLPSRVVLLVQKEVAERIIDEKETQSKYDLNPKFDEIFTFQVLDDKKLC